MQSAVPDWFPVQIRARGHFSLLEYIFKQNQNRCNGVKMSVITDETIMRAGYKVLFNNVDAALGSRDYAKARGYIAVIRGYLERPFDSEMISPADKEIVLHRAGKLEEEAQKTCVTEELKWGYEVLQNDKNKLLAIDAVNRIEIYGGEEAIATQNLSDEFNALKFNAHKFAMSDNLDEAKKRIAEAGKGSLWGYKFFHAEIELGKAIEHARAAGMEFPEELEGIVQGLSKYRRRGLPGGIPARTRVNAVYEGLQNLFGAHN